MSENNEISIPYGNDTVRIEFASGSTPVDMKGIREKETELMGKALLKAASMLDEIVWLEPDKPYSDWTVSKAEQKLSAGKGVIHLTLRKSEKERMSIETHFDLNGSLHIFRFQTYGDFHYVLSVLPDIHAGYLAMRSPAAVGLVKAAVGFLRAMENETPAVNPVEDLITEKEDNTIDKTEFSNALENSGKEGLNMDLYIYMTGKAWESNPGKEIGGLLQRCGFITTNMSFEPECNLRDGVMKAHGQNQEVFNYLDCLFLSLDPVKGEFYEMLTIRGEGGWERISNRPRDLDPILDAKATVLYKGMPLDRTCNEQQRRGQ